MLVIMLCLWAKKFAFVPSWVYAETEKQIICGCSSKQ